MIAGKDSKSDNIVKELEIDTKKCFFYLLLLYIDHPQ